MRFHSGRFCLRVNIRKAIRATESATAPSPTTGNRKNRACRYHSSGKSSVDSKKIIKKTAWQAWANGSASLW